MGCNKRPNNFDPTVSSATVCNTTLAIKALRPKRSRQHQLIADQFNGSLETFVVQNTELT
jgi:hypothetical protein